MTTRVEPVASLDEASPAREEYAPEHLELHVTTRALLAALFATRARSSSEAPRCSATTPRARTTSCPPAAWREAREGSGWRCSSSRSSSSGRPPRARRRGARSGPCAGRGPAPPCCGGRARPVRGVVTGRHAGARRAARPASRGFEPYAWAPGGGGGRPARARPGAGSEVRPEHSAAARCAAGAARGELRNPERVPGGAYRDLCEAAAPYPAPPGVVRRLGAGRCRGGRRRSDPARRRTFLGQGRLPSRRSPRIALPRRDDPRRGRPTTGPRRDLSGSATPNNPTGRVTPAATSSRSHGRRPDAIVVVDEAYFEYGGETVVPWSRSARTSRAADDVEGVRLRGAAGRLRDRGARGPRPSSRRVAPRHRSRARPRASRPPPCATRARRRARSQSASACARRSSPPASTAPGAGNFVSLRTDDDLAARARGAGASSCGASRRASGSPLRRPTENDVLLAALGAEPGPAPGRQATLCARPPRPPSASRSTSTAAAARVATGIGFLDHLLTLLAFHAGFDLDFVAGGDLDVDEHHTVEDVLAAFGDASAAGTRRRATA